MSADYPAAQEHFVPRSFMFNSNAQKAIVIHKTEAKLNQIQIANLQRKQDQRHQLSTQIRIVLLSVGTGAILSFVATIILHAIHVL